MLALLAVIVSAFAVLASLSAGIRPQRLTGFLVVAREPVVPSESPIGLALRGFPPNTGMADKDLPAVRLSARSPLVRAISVSAHDIDFFVAGKKAREIQLAARCRTCSA
jgi:hypothetical protein